MVPDNLRLYLVGRSFCGGSSSDLEVLHEGSTADEWPRWHGTEMAPPWAEWHNRSAELLYHLAACDIDGAHK